MKKSILTIVFGGLLALGTVFASSDKPACCKKNAECCKEKAACCESNKKKKSKADCCEEAKACCKEQAACCK